MNEIQESAPKTQLGSSELEQLPQMFERCLEKFKLLSSDYEQNLQILTELSGEILSADYSLYKRLKNDKIINVAIWNAPESFHYAEDARNTISYDVITNYPDEFCLIRNLQESKYTASVPIIGRLGLKTYLGYKIYFENQCRGMICNMYRHDYQPNEAEKQILKLIASYIGIEESRALATESYNASQAIYRRIVETSNEGILWLDKDCKVSYVNKKMLDLLGYEADEVIGYEMEKWLFPEDMENHSQKVNDRLQGKKDTYERRFRRKDGSEVWAMISASAMQDENGNFTGSFGMCSNITERKKSEQELLDSEERYRLLFENAPVGILLHTDGEVVYINPAALKIFGASSKEDVMGKAILDYVHPDHRAAAINNIKRLMQGETGIYPFEYLFQRLDGSFFPVEVYANQLHYQNRLSIQIIISDISDRKKTEAIKLRNEAGLRSIINILQHRSESLQDFINYTLNEAIRLTGSLYGYMSRYDESTQTFETFTYSPNALEESNISDISIQRSDGNPGLWKAVAVQRKPLIINDYQTEYANRKGYPDGHIMLKRFLAIPVFSDDQIVAVLGMANKQTDYDETDTLLLTLLMDAVWKVVDRKAKEMELLKLSRAVEQSPVSILITDTEGKIEYVNSFFSQITGWQPSEVIGKKTSLFKSGNTPNQLYQELWNCISSGNTWKGEFHNRKKNGDLYWEEATISPLTSPGGNIINYIAVKEDITQRKQITAELVQAKEAAEQMNRIKTNFLASMSHELRTPLVGILGFSELLPSMISDPRAIDMANTIHSSGYRLLNTLNHILDLSRIEAEKIDIKWRLVDANSLLKSVAKLYRAVAAKKGLSLELILPTDKILLETDMSLLEHILNELVNNAIKYTDQGKVLLTLSEDGPSGSEVCIKVKDTGIGISPSQQTVVFDAFRQGSEGFERSYEGSGLGLTIAHKYTQLLGASICLNSETGKGSEFCVCFPARMSVKADQLPSEAKLPDSQEAASWQTRPQQLPRILLIDDDLVIHQLAGYMLSELATIDYSTDGDKALELASGQTYAAILLDIHLKGKLGGLQVLQKLRATESLQAVPIIAVTAYSMLGDREHFLSLGCSHYLSKPFSKNELVELLSHILGQTTRQETS